jgi:hypothetical protein
MLLRLFVEKKPNQNFPECVNGVCYKSVDVVMETCMACQFLVPKLLLKRSPEMCLPELIIVSL